MQIQLHDAQKTIAKDRSRFRVVCCGRRFGKTTLAVYEMLAKAVYTSDSVVVYIAPTFPQARDICWKMLKRISAPVSEVVNESRLEITIRCVDGGTSQIWLRSWEAAETLKGQKFDFVVVDEVAMMRNFKMGWEEYVRPCLTDSRGHALFISTPKGFNHFYDLFNKGETDTGKDFKSFHFTTYDNPHIPPPEIEDAKKELTPDRFAQEYMADFRKATGLVYPEFDRERHVCDSDIRLPEFTRRVCGVDWGWTNPAAILYICEDRDANYWIVDEWYHRQRTTEQIIQKTKMYKPNEVYPDPAEPDRIDQMLNERLNVREVSKDIENGINRVRELFKSGRIKILPHCSNLILELETYHYPEETGEKNERELPVDKDNHAVDALRYVLYTIEPQDLAFDFNISNTDW
ncbi:MAG: terminase family protein [Patescibacteria group bacterium]|nr:terminase family protein [Patescibacteria group bacterium]